MDFHVGQHIAMLKDAYEREPVENLERIKLCQSYGTIFPQEGRVYVVRDIMWFPHLGKSGLLLDTVRNERTMELVDGGPLVEPPFPLRWFRPLKKLKVDDFVGQIEPVSA